MSFTEMQWKPPPLLISQETAFIKIHSCKEQRSYEQYDCQHPLIDMHKKKTLVSKVKNGATEKTARLF